MITRESVEFIINSQHFPLGVCFNKNFLWLDLVLWVFQLLIAASPCVDRIELMTSGLSVYVEQRILLVINGEHRSEMLRWQLWNRWVIYTDFVFPPIGERAGCFLPGLVPVGNSTGLRRILRSLHREGAALRT